MERGLESGRGHFVKREWLSEGIGMEWQRRMGDENSVNSLYKYEAIKQ